MKSLCPKVANKGFAFIFLERTNYPVDFANGELERVVDHSDVLMKDDYLALE